MNPAAVGTSDVSPTTTTGPSPAPNPKMRKRTKTGCLTCRKRRIKCGEERPTCANCIKSKRQCEGYNQRVVFKPPIGDWPNHPGIVVQYHTSRIPGSQPPPYRPPPSATQPADNLTSIQPRPLTQFQYAGETGAGLAHLNTQAYVSGAPPYGQDPSYQQPLPSPHHPQPLHSPHHQIPTPTSTNSYFPQPSPVHSTFPGQYPHESSVPYPEPQQYPQSQYQSTPVSYESHVDSKPTSSQAPQEPVYYRPQPQPTSRPEEQTSYTPQTSLSPQTEDYPAPYAESRPSLPRYSSHSQVPLSQPQVTAADLSQAGPYTLPLAVSQAVSHAVTHADSSHSTFQPVQIPQHDVASDVNYARQHVVYGMSRV